MKVAKKSLSVQGQQIIGGQDEFELAFKQIKNIVFVCKNLDIWKEDVGLLNYYNLVMATVRAKDPDNKRKYVMQQCNPFVKMYEKFREAILEEDWGFLSGNKISFKIGKTGTAVLPLSDVYIHLMQKDEDKLEDVKAKMLFCFKHLSPQGSDDRKKLTSLCSEFESMESSNTHAQDIGSIVSTVKSSISGTNMKEPTIEGVIPVIQNIMGNKQMQDSIGALAKGLMSGNLDLPTLVQQVKNSAANQANDDSEDSEDSDDKGKEEAHGTDDEDKSA
jgi:hypothetical protein